MKSIQCCFIMLSLALVVFVTTVAQSADLQELSGCKLVDAPGNDGDSFRIRTPGGDEHNLRLYFVDCSETSADNNTDASRVRKQTAYFGLSSHADTLDFGRKASAFTRKVLSEPFTVHTAFATAPGRSAGGRVYGFVRTADGKDLAEVLVAAGLARVYGVYRRTSTGVHHKEAKERFHDIELAAALEKMGLWAHSDPERIVAMRAKIRADDAELATVRAEVRGLAYAGDDSLVNINAASSEALINLPGIGPAMAERIIAGRPYRTIEDLQRVSGIGPKTLESLRNRLTVDPEKNP